jgi:hypothetical protein
LNEKIIVVIAVGFLFATLTGCASSPYHGGLFSNVNLASPQLHYPIDAVKAEKSGDSSCMSVLGLIAAGDASVGKAMEEGGITKIHHVNYGYTSFLFIFAKHTITTVQNKFN